MDIQTFAHLVSHDLKAPLNGIASLLDFLEEDYAERLDDAGRENLQLMRMLATRGVNKVEALRLYARTASAPVASRAVDLAGLASRLLSTAGGRVAPARVEAVVAPDLPAVAGDPALLPLLLDRLFSNALTFNAQDPRRVWVERLPAPARPVPSGYVALAVRDNGMGIPGKSHDEVFDIFKRLHGPDKFGGGAGVGLAVARLIARRHGGDMWVQASNDAGTTIGFSLPASPSDDGAC